MNAVDDCWCVSSYVPDCFWLAHADLVIAIFVFGWRMLALSLPDFVSVGACFIMVWFAHCQTDFAIVHFFIIYTHGDQAQGAL